MWFLAQRSFPPNPEPAIWVVAFHIVLLALVVIALGATIWMAKSRPRFRHLAIWPILMFAALVLTNGYEGPEFTKDFLRGYTFFVFVIGVANLLATYVALVQRRERTSRAWLISGCVIGLGLAILLLLPQVPQVREAARRTDCKNRLKSIALAMHDWEADHGRLPDLTVSAAEGPPRSWRVELLSYMEMSKVRERYRDDATWDSEANLPAAQTSMPDLECPSARRRENQRDGKGRYFTHFLAVTGPDTVFADGRGMNLHDVAEADGTSRTLMLVEAVGRNIVWTEPRDADTSQQPIGLNLPGATVFDSPGLGSTYHHAGVNMVFADATVYTVPKKIDPEILRALTTVHGNDPADRGF